MDDIANNSFMPASCMQGTVEDFYTAMAKEEEHFKKLYEKANAEGCKLNLLLPMMKAKLGGFAAYRSET